MVIDIYWYFGYMEVEMTYEDILDNVRNIIRNKAPENSVLNLIKEINQLEDEISEKINPTEETLEKEHEAHYEIGAIGKSGSLF